MQAARKREEEERQVRGSVVAAEALGDGGLVNFPLRVASGSHDACGICLETFTEGGEAPVLRHVFWPCQHVRQCGDCALRIWQVPKAKAAVSMVQEQDRHQAEAVQALPVTRE